MTNDAQDVTAIREAGSEPDIYRMTGDLRTRLENIVDRI